VEKLLRCIFASGTDVFLTVAQLCERVSMHKKSLHQWGLTRNEGRVLVREWGRFQAREELFHPIVTIRFCAKEPNV
jgi:hypothetical protein